MKKTITWKTDRPKKAGTYLCTRDGMGGFDGDYIRVVRLNFDPEKDYSRQWWDWYDQEKTVKICFGYDVYAWAEDDPTVSKRDLNNVFEPFEVDE